MKGKKIVSLLTALGLGLTLFAQSTGAITYGQPDGDKHKNVGALIVQNETTGKKRQICTGTLIAENVFLTASHCTEGVDGKKVWVSFDQDIDPVDETVSLHEGRAVTNPAYSQRQSNTGDIAVVVLDKPITDIKPASLPTLGLFDGLFAKGNLKDQKFTAVGYGIQEPEQQAGGVVNAYDGLRRVAVSEFSSLTKYNFHLSQNAAAGDAGTCNGDSGGPYFFGAGAEETDMVAAVTVTGDMTCVATGVNYRLDTASAREFLGRYVELP